jgi:hypothetical protein
MKQIVKMVLSNTAAQRNPVAAALSSGQFRRQVVRSKKSYARRDRNNRKDWE